MRAILFACVLVCGCFVAGLPAKAEGFTKVGTILVSDAYIWPSSDDMAAAFVAFENTSQTQADSLVGVATTSATAELHDMAIDAKGVMQMRAVESLPIPAKKMLRLKPGGTHIMLFDLKKPLKTGQTLPITLVFQKAGRKTLSFKVLPVGTQTSTMF